jgi:hypothetical protein
MLAIEYLSLDERYKEVDEVSCGYILESLVVAK